LFPARGRDGVLISPRFPESLARGGLRRRFQVLGTFQGRRQFPLDGRQFLAIELPDLIGEALHSTSQLEIRHFVARQFAE